jgi:hypothetical protein
MPRIPRGPRRRLLVPWLALAFVIGGLFLAPGPSGVSLAQTVDCAALAAGGGSGDGTTGTDAGSAPDSDPVYDYVFVIDISRSMSGSGSNNRNIFPEVKEAIIDYLREIPLGANLRIIPFSGGVNPDRILEITLETEDDRQAAIDHVDDLVANGQGTWIYNAVDIALKYLEAMQGDDDQAHIQSLLLYTDGQGNGPNDRPVTTLVERLNVARSDQQYLYVKYVALGTDVPGEEELTEGGVDVVKVPEGAALSTVREVGLAPNTIDAGAVLAGQSATAARQLCTIARVGDASGEELQLSVDSGSLPDGVEIDLEPGSMKVGTDPADIQLTIKANSDVTPGTYRAQLNVRSSNADDLVPVPGAVTVNFEVQPGPTPTPEPTPTPTATPTPGVTIGSSFPLNLGKQRVNLESDDTGPVTLSGEMKGDFAGGANLSVQLSALDAANPLPLQIPTDVYLRSGDVDNLAEVQLEDGSNTVEVVARVDQAQIRALGKGTYQFHGQLLANSGQAAFVPEGAVQQTDGTVLLPFVFTVEVYEPFDPIPWLIAGGAGLAGLFVLGMILSSFPRLPAGSALLAPDGHLEPLRDAQRTRLMGRLFGGSLSIGGDGNDVNLGLAGLAGVAKGTWFWRKRTIFEPARDDIRMSGETLEEGRPRRLDISDQLQIDRQTYTYVERRQASRDGRDDDDDDAGYSAPADYDEPPPKRGRFSRRSKSYDDDRDYDDY